MLGAYTEDLDFLVDNRGDTNQPSQDLEDAMPFGGAMFAREGSAFASTDNDDRPKAPQVLASVPGPVPSERPPPKPDPDNDDRKPAAKPEPPIVETVTEEDEDDTEVQPTAKPEPPLVETVTEDDEDNESDAVEGAAATEAAAGPARAKATKKATIKTGRKIYRPKLVSEYEEPDLGPDLLDGMELIFQDFGKSLRRQVEPLGPRDDIIVFDVDFHQEELNQNIRWERCPEEHRGAIEEVIREFWDVFASEGLRRNIRGFQCRVDTGATKPICCKPPRYGPHEAHIMIKLVTRLEDNGMVEDDDGPWGSQIVLAGKPGQENKSWDEYIWRLCVSYRRVNQKVRIFEFPIPRCDDAVDEIPPWAKFFLTMDLDAGYWQVKLEEESRAKLAFFTPNGKKRWTVMPMGFANSHAIFVAMMTVMQTEWHKNAPAAAILYAGSKVIVDDILLYAATVTALLAYWKCMLSVLQHYRATVNLRKCRFLDPRGVEFVGIDVEPEGNAPARAKTDAFQKLGRPHTWADLRMLIGVFGFYQKWLQNFELRIQPWRKLQGKQPKPGSLSFDEERQKFDAAWEADAEVYDALLDELKQDILSGPVLARPDPNHRFYLKTDWSRNGFGAVLCQADDDPESIEAERAYIAGGPCPFDKTRTSFRLRPVAFLSRRPMTKSELSWHSYVGEAAVGRWAMQKWKKWLLGRPFTWLADCSGLKRFFEECPEDIPHSMIQRWRMELLQYEFDMHHRPADMLTDCDMLSRYNKATAKWREEAEMRQRQTMATTNVTSIVPRARASLFQEHELRNNRSPEAFAVLPVLEYRGEPQWRKSETSARFSPERAVLAEGCFAVPVPEALQALGLARSNPASIDNFGTGPDSHRHLLEAGASNSAEFWETLTGTVDDVTFDWYMAVYNEPHVPVGSRDVTLGPWLATEFAKVTALVEHTSLRAAMLWVPTRQPDGLRAFMKRTPTAPEGWSAVRRNVRNTAYGGSIETQHDVLFLLPAEIAEQMEPDLKSPPGAASSPMAGMLDDDHGWVPDSLQFEDLDISKPTVVQRQAHGESEASPKVARLVKLRTSPTPIGGHPAYDIHGPAPSIHQPKLEEDFFNGPFGIWYERNGEPICRPVRLPEVLRMLGVDDGRMQAWLLLPPDLVVQRAWAAPGIAAVTQVLSVIHHAESMFEAAHGHTPLLLADPTPSTVIPLPTMQQWRDATTADEDLQAIINALQADQQLNPGQLSDKRYLEPFQLQQFEVENGVIYCYEQSRTARVRQLRTRVVPIGLRRVIVVACHSSPFGGHSGLNRTMFRIQARYWWPGMTKDVKTGVLSCAHCNLANAASHEAQLKLHSLACDAPFDVVFLDFWSPGDMVDKYGNVKVLTYLDGMTSFAMASFLSLSEMDTQRVADACVSSFFSTVGLPRLVILDADSRFAGTFKATLELLRIPVEAVSRENHKAIRNENFHRYLNKVERINTADVGSLWRWKQGVLFAMYAWNASPADGTDVPRSLAAIGREFPFPVDLSEPTPRSITSEGQHALDHFEAASPLLFKQRELLNIVNSERRRRHNELRNQAASGVSFEPGDLVIVRKQVKSNAANNFSAKLVFKTRGPYRVIEQLNPNSYKLQKLPFLRGLGRRGRFVKESAARLTRLPSTLIFHKQADGADTRFSLMGGDIAENALEKWLGVIHRGAYVKAQGDPAWAFEPLASMWSDDLPDDNDDDNDDDEDNDQEDTAMPPVDADSEDDEAEAQVEPPAQRVPPPQPQADPSKLVTPSDSDKKALRKLHKALLDSLDKLVIVRVPDDIGRPTFRIGQIVWEEQDPYLNKHFGVYQVRWWRQHQDDRLQRSMVNSRFWPDVWTTDVDGALSREQVVRPGKVSLTLAQDSTLTWRNGDVSLAEDLVVGPFEFSQARVPMQGPKKRAISEPNRIDDLYWKILADRSHQFGIDATKIRLEPSGQQGHDISNETQRRRKK